VARYSGIGTPNISLQLKRQQTSMHCLVLLMPPRGLCCCDIRHVSCEQMAYCQVLRSLQPELSVSAHLLEVCNVPFSCLCWCVIWYICKQILKEVIKFESSIHCYSQHSPSFAYIMMKLCAAESPRSTAGLGCEQLRI